ncbi:MAG: polysaccharide ABC transporter ATP-binding protein, partial [Bacteroidota bacterium]
SLLEVGTGFHPELTGRENIFLNGSILGMRKHEIARKLDEIIDFSGVERYIDTPVKRYSSGMYVRLAFAVAAHLESEILIVDEVLAVGDAEFQKKCLGKMGQVSKTEGKTILFVSHDLRAVSTICGKALVLENGCLKSQGPVNDIIGSYLSDNSNRITQKVIDSGVHFVSIENKSSLVSLPLQNDLNISLLFRADKDLTSFYFDFAITNHLGEIVIHSRNALSGDPADIFSGQNIKVAYNVKQPRLLPGEYFLTVYVFSVGITGQDDVYLWLESVPLLTIAGVSAETDSRLFDLVSGIRSKTLHESNIRIQNNDE